MVSAPGMSNLRPARATRAPRGMNRIAATSTSAATGAGTSSVHRQLISVSRPERTRPSEKPLAPKTVYTLNARFRIGPSGNVVVSRDMLAGAVNERATQHDQDGPQLRCPDLAVPVTGIGEKCFG